MSNSYPTYPFPHRDTRFSESSLNGTTLIQLALGECQINFIWCNGITILSESNIRIEDPSGEHKLISACGIDAAPLLRFLGNKATRVHFVDREFMAIDLADGSRLTFIVDNSPYESFQVIGERSRDDWLLIW